MDTIVNKVETPQEVAIQDMKQEGIKVSCLRIHKEIKSLNEELREQEL